MSSGIKEPEKLKWEDFLKVYADVLYYEQFKADMIAESVEIRLRKILK
jgi:hypothetical protein